MSLVVVKLYKQSISLFYPQGKRSGGKKERIIGKHSSRIYSCSPPTVCSPLLRNLKTRRADSSETLTAYYRKISNAVGRLLFCELLSKYYSATEENLLSFLV